ncbi:hypothetical protein A2841_01495 [Candidatus Kaiserbacteria bacterium RIFCSPHIGHO2_01_FULL_48_10]|uniref:Glycosyltransferase subfamily 4-like N-terminal domain-containing protein n=1 Tax=Candidatus Kaiserbacteria bacterium RIFCSPHIGHO2_01_FULL_48_10 TaxID=1798476 RepID=A0A1F6C1Y8_9BACT|nr:MAG: hypothetical protein A2841_01495 [Candidatus Kaiserbacteria bacterium RIFCSPHIGHO2_01_FULL_48_10]
MRFIALSQDQTILRSGKTQDRIKSYGTIVDELTVILFGVGVPHEEHISPNVRIIASGGGMKVSAFIRGVQTLFRIAPQYDLITAQDPFFLGFAAVWAGRIKKIPVQIQVHTDCFSKNYWSESFVRVLQALLASWVLPRAACVRAVSERVAKRVRQMTSAPVSVLPIRVSVDAIPTPRPTIFHDRFTALAVSRLSHEKQLSVIIDALAQTQDIDLVIVGDGPLRVSLERRAKERDVAGRVRFEGGQNDLSAYYQHAQAFVQCSRYEGYGMTLVEAALAGLPIVSTDVGIIGDMLRPDEEAIVVSAQPKEYADALGRLQTEREFAYALGARAKKRAESFQKSEAEYLADYQHALAACAVRK